MGCIVNNEELVQRFKNILLTEGYSEEDIQFITRYAENLIDDYLPEVESPFLVPLENKFVDILLDNESK